MIKGLDHLRLVHELLVVLGLGDDLDSGRPLGLFVLGHVDD